MNVQKKIFLVLLLLISVYFILIFNTRETCWEDRYYGLQILQDDDRNVYYERGLWVVDETVPYTTSFQEYPQVAVYFFALPHLFRVTLSQYRIIFSGMMALILLLAFLLMLEIIKILHGDYRNLFLLILPSMLWFSFNRFDLLAAALSILSLLLILKEKNNLAFFVLGLAVMTKWYPCLYAPLFLYYIYNNQRVGKRKWVKLIAPSLILVGVIGLFCLHTLQWVGIEGLTNPYKFHWQRGSNRASLFHFLRFLFNTPVKYTLSRYLFFVLQFISVPIVLVMGIKKKEELIIAMGIVTLFFILFAKYHSPQWLLWVSPLVLLIKDRSTFVLLCIYDLSTYLYFPLGHDLSNMLFSDKATAHAAHEGIIMVNVLIKICIIIWLERKKISLSGGDWRSLEVAEA
jgi:hypothetical protein